MTEASAIAMSFEPFSGRVVPAQRDAARRMYETLAAQGTVDPDRFLAYLDDQGWLDEATVLLHCPDETTVRTVVRAIRRPEPDATVIRHQQPIQSIENSATANQDLPQPVSGFGIAVDTFDATASRYNLLGRLSAGAMGEIQLAQDRGLRRKVAYKQLLKDIEALPGLNQRFLLEAQVMAQLDHPNVVPVYSLEPVAEGRFAYAMKLVRGQTLEELIQEARTCIREQRPLPLELSRATLLDHFLKVCDAMAYAHAKGVLHRDLKPANIMVGAFHEVYVMDWGLARVNDIPDPTSTSAEPMSMADDGSATAHTRVGDLIGTPAYMSPEQASGDHADLDARSDLYALGLILFELVSLQRALQADSLDALLNLARCGEKKPLQAPAAALPIPRELRAIVAKATAPLRIDRYPSVAALADDLRHFLRDEPVTALPDTGLRRLLRWIGRHRQATLLIMMSVLLVALSTISWTFYQRAQTLTQIQTHKERLSRYLTSVSEQNHLIDRHFLFFEKILEGLATAFVQARLYGAPSREPVYLIDQFRNPHQAPPDLAVAHRYRDKAISTDHPVYIVSPGVSATSSVLRNLMRRIAPLRKPLRRLFVLGNNPQNPWLPTLDVHQMIDAQYRAISWAYFALREGLLVVYPGHEAELPDGYDSRDRPWYQEAVSRNGNLWGTPHQDRLGQGLLMSCSTALRDEDQQVLGVASVDISLGYVIDRLMKIPDPHLRESFLLDQKGHIILRSSDEHRDPGEVEARNRQAPELYPDPQIVADIRVGKKSGYREVRYNDQELWIVYDDIETLGWIYVVEFVP